MSDCIFCKMIDGEIKPDIVLETDSVLAFHDSNPQAPTHVLIIPMQHIPTMNDLEPEDVRLMGDLSLAARKVAEREGVSGNFRTTINCGRDGGQVVFHLHMHLLGWPSD
ncbi:histidine triad nucleotide-binding protein [Marinobacter salarius]|jgi:histidine triad (HIT) family protein|uniref:histidine triad nucleotide-binding protein n=1 Tax=Marinobacter salarius TaxID=1420917 RepID=UPI001BCAF2A2|nr:histidine triad nucleotide-binding protein [Marinobacter salarius]MBS8232582.1 histidine triad nucleotide-binding protein [Marinobacter salarius]